MHGHTLQRGTAPVVEPPRPVSGAVCWIDRDRALVARTLSSGEPVVRELRRPAGLAEELGPFLARVVDEIGERDRVVILGPDAMRVELEREYVAIHHRPDRLIDVEDAPELDDRRLLDRLALLVGLG